MKRIHVHVLAAIVFFCAFTAGSLCWGAGDLTVSAAASLTNAFNEAGKKFEAENPGTHVLLNFGASGVLLQQMQRGAPVDVFASADMQTMDQAEAKNLMAAGTRKIFTGNKLVLIVPAGSTLGIKSLSDLVARADAKVAVGKPETVPAGRYAEKALKHAGAFDALSKRFIFGESVRQILDYVSRAEVDAGFVYSSDVEAASGKVRVIAEMEGTDPIRYPIAVLAGSDKKELAQKFINFLTGPEGEAILARHGFGKPDGGKS